MYSDRQTLANSVDPDQTPQNAASDQGLPICHSFSNFTHSHSQLNGLVDEKYRVKSKGGPNLPKLSKISHGNEMLSQSGIRLNASESAPGFEQATLNCSLHFFPIQVGFSTLFTTLPHDLIKEKLTQFIEWTFNREGGTLYLACNKKPIFYFFISLFFFFFCFILFYIIFLFLIQKSTAVI